MKRRTVIFTVVALLSALPAQGSVPATLPEIAIQFAPKAPSSADELTLTLSGQWPNACVPEAFQVQVVAADSLWIDLLLPGWDAKGECEPPVCLQVLTFWQLSGPVQALAAGSYEVFARAVSCDETGDYEQIATLTVVPGVGGPVSGPIAPGERVVLLEDNPLGVPNLKAGHAGTVVCCDSKDCSGHILVSWDFWTDGKLDSLQCANAAETLYPVGSAIWIDPDEVRLGRHFNQCGTVQKGLEGCIQFEADDGKVYNVVGWSGLYTTLDGGGALQFGDRVRVRGLLNATPPGPDELRICPQLDGDLLHPTISLCPEPEPEPKPEPEPEPEPKPDPDPKPGPDSIVINISGNPLALQQVPGSPGSYGGCADLTVVLNFQAQLSVQITPAPGVGGTWTGTLDPDILGPGEVTTELCIEVVDLDISSLPPGNDVQVATVTLLAAPAP